MLANERRLCLNMNIELYLKVDFLGTGVGFFYKRAITGNVTQKHMDGPDF